MVIGTCNNTQLVHQHDGYSTTIKRSTKCLSNNCNNFIFIYYGCNDLSDASLTPKVVNSSGETGLAVTVWTVAIICLLLVIFFCVFALFGVIILLMISFQQHASLQKSQQIQIQLLLSLSEHIRKAANSHLEDCDGRATVRNARCHHNTSRCNRISSPIDSNSPFHPRNNTPVSSQFNLTLSSHASFSKSPSISSWSSTLSEEFQNDTHAESSGQSVVRPIRGRYFERSRRERVDGREQKKSKIISAPEDYRRKNEFPLLARDSQAQASGMQRLSGNSRYSNLRKQISSPPKEYWL